MADPQARVNPATDTQQRILIVDDSPTSIRVLAHFLRDMGSVHFATSGAAALAMAAEVRPDVVLLDVEMPEMDGYQVCRALKNNAELASIPVIFVTAHTDAENELKGLNAGAVDFISKPIDEPIVRARVRTHLTLKSQTDLLRELAAHDGLTGTFNRRSFDARIDQESRRHRRVPGELALAMVDIDCFKLYNDHYGHQRGDDCLRAVAAAISQSARRPGDMVARYGGEEFAVILPNTDIEGAQRYGELLCQQVRDLEIPHAASTAAGIVTISVGVAAGFPQEDGCSASIVQAADRALYRAKGQGRNRAVCVSMLNAAPSYDETR